MEDLDSHTFVIALLRSNIQVSVWHSSDVDVHIHQTRDQILSGAVDTSGSRGSLDCEVSNELDSITSYQHGCASLGRLSGSIDQGHVLDQKTGLLSREHRQADRACDHHHQGDLRTSLHSPSPFI